MGCMTPPHTFHIPVMGTAFTIDTPLKVARYGISSVVSLVDDHLVENLREYYCGQYDEEYTAILRKEPQSRPRRITAYLNLLHRGVQRQFEELKRTPFAEGSDILRYFDLLDDRSPMKREFLRVMDLPAGDERSRGEDALRQSVVAGKIDVNIMTKLDRVRAQDPRMKEKVHSDAQSALQGFASSDLDASVILSAGLNLKLFSYLATLDDFHQDERGWIKKRVVLKVSDFRSAMTQGKIFARKGIWISEYRVESGLNCGGHSFPTQGHLLGPILEEFKQRKVELNDFLYAIYKKSLKSLERAPKKNAPQVRITTQGGIGTSQEDRFLMRYFELDGTGWGTPFLLVPEATTVDDEMLQDLANAGVQDLVLSNASPLGLPFHNMMNSASERERRKRIEEGKPGSPCWNGFLAANTEFSVEPICTASSEYQNKKIKQLKAKNLAATEYQQEFDSVVEKSCICSDLGDAALKKYDIHVKGKPNLTPAICPGPNLAFFSKTSSLQAMVSHIYGRISVLNPTCARPHMFLNELGIYIEYLQDKVSKAVPAHAQDSDNKYFREFAENLFSGIRYYETLPKSFVEESEAAKKRFLDGLDVMKDKLKRFTAKHQAAFAGLTPACSPAATLS